jgi:hypothetical protein
MREEHELGDGEMMVAESEGFWIEGNKRVETKYWRESVPTDRVYSEITMCPKHYSLVFAGHPHIHLIGDSEELGRVCLSCVLQLDPRDSTKAVVSTLVRWNRTDSFMRKTVELASLLSLTASLMGQDGWERGGGGGGGYVASSAVDASKLLRCVQKTCPDLASFQLTAVVDETSPHFSQLERNLLGLEEGAVFTQLKVGVLYCREGQAGERDMYSNRDPSSGFQAFLSFLGSPFTAEKEQSKYNGGLHRGQCGVRGVWGDIEFIFHVSTLLPFDESEGSQQIERKRHLGNDTILMVFVEGNHQLSPLLFKSKVNQIFIFVRPSPSGAYHIQVATKDDVAYFGPEIPDDPSFCFLLDDNMKNFLFAKLVSGHMAAFQCSKYKHYWHARQEMLTASLKDVL